MDSYVFALFIARNITVYYLPEQIQKYRKREKK